MAYAVSKLLENSPREPISKENFLDDMISVLGNLPKVNFDEKTFKNICLLKTNLDEDYEKVLEKTGNSFDVSTIVPAAIAAFVQSPADFEKTIAKAANYCNDADSTAAIAGAMSGAHNGYNGIPFKYIKQIENRDLLLKTAKNLYQTKLQMPKQLSLQLD